MKMCRLNEKAHEAAKYAQIEPGVMVVLAAASEITGTPLYQWRALWSKVPDYLKPRKLRELRRMVRQIQAGKLTFVPAENNVNPN